MWINVRWKLRIWSNLLKKFLMENLIFCAVRCMTWGEEFSGYSSRCLGSYWNKFTENTPSVINHVFLEDIAVNSHKPKRQALSKNNAPASSSVNPKSQKPCILILPKRTPSNTNLHTHIKKPSLKLSISNQGGLNKEIQPNLCNIFSIFIFKWTLFICLMTLNRVKLGCAVTFKK